MYRVLIVDDEAEIRNGYARFFPWSAQGFEVAGQAADAQEALRFLRNGRVDLMVCDIVMPAMDGLTLSAMAAQEFPALKIVILSGHGEFEYARRAIQPNVFSYVLKSDKHEVLIETLGKVKKVLDGEAVAPTGGSHIDTVMRYVRERCATANLREAAELVNMSPNYLCKLFKERTGTHFHRYVISVRLEKAKGLLERTGLRVCDVAEEVGYSEGKNFNRVFKKTQGISPKEYQLRHRAAGTAHADDKR